MNTPRRLCTFFITLALALSIAGCVRVDNTTEIVESEFIIEETQNQKAKNVILFIGDGMGLAQIESTALAALGQSLDENGNPPRLAFTKLPVNGYLTTFATDSLVTDSAAGATALGCGVKTNNGRISQDPAGAPVKTIAEIAKEKGKAVGILSSVGLNHATPACFYAHNEARKNYDAILDDAFNTKSWDVLMGGGVFGDNVSKQTLTDKAKAANIVYFDIENISMLTADFVKGHRVFGVFDANNNHQLDYEAQRDDANTEPHLSNLTLTTLDIIDDDPNGFFLMVEGGSIDWACHDNNFENMVGEMLEFDRTIEKTIAYLDEKQLLDSTLIIVTADHETGGLCITGPYKDPMSESAPIKIEFISKGHTAIPVPVFAQGPGSAALNGKNDATKVFRVMEASFE